MSDKTNEEYKRGYLAALERAEKIARSYGHSAPTWGFKTEMTFAAADCADEIADDIRAIKKAMD